jgi:allantoin racemase
MLYSQNRKCQDILMNIHICVVTPVVPTGLTQASDFEGILGPEDRLSYVEIENGPASIETAFDAMLAAPDVVAKMIEAERNGAHAIVIDCMGDPGLLPGRECLSIPVLGPCQTSMNLACTLGHRYSILAVTEDMHVQFENQARTYGTWDKYASTRSVEVPVLELMPGSPTLRAQLLEQALQAIKHDGADTIIIGCTGMVGVAKMLQDDILAAGWSVPVIDPVRMTVKIARTLVEAGLCHSKTAYPTPKAKEIRGYATFANSQFSQKMP